MFQGDEFGVPTGPGRGRTLTDDLAIQHNDGPDRRARRDAALHHFGQFKCSIEWPIFHDYARPLKTDMAVYDRLMWLSKSRWARLAVGDSWPWYRLLSSFEP